MVAVSLLFGVAASTLLTLVVIPVLYYWVIGDRGRPSEPSGVLQEGEDERGLRADREDGPMPQP